MLTNHQIKACPSSYIGRFGDLLHFHAAYTLKIIVAWTQWD